MNTINFGAYNSYDDFGLILSHKTIGSPTPKLLSVDVPYSDGELDYTEYFGEVKYENRALSFEFSAAGKDFLDRYANLLNLLNGRKMKVSLSQDADFYYFGRVVVNEWATEKNIGKVVIDVTAEPYKMKTTPTVIYKNIVEKTAICCPNLRKSVIPTIRLTTAGAKATVAFNGVTSDLITKEDGAVTVSNIIFTEGENVLTVTPAEGATLPMGISIEYQEGSL